MNSTQIRSYSSECVNILRGLFFCPLPRLLRHHLLTGRMGVKRWATSLQACTLRLFLPATHPSSHPFSPLQLLITDLSFHTHPQSHCCLIDEATFDNGIRNWGVCLVIRYYQSCLITTEEDPRQTDGFLCVQI